MDPNADTDHDGLTDGYERMFSHTEPLTADTDHDGLTDGAEIHYGTNPLGADSWLSHAPDPALPPGPSDGHALAAAAGMALH